MRERDAGERERERKRDRGRDRADERAEISEQEAMLCIRLI